MPPRDRAALPESAGTALAGHVLAFGFCPRAEFLAELVQSSCSDSAIDRLMRRLPGSFHLVVARSDGTLRVQGSASGLRRVFITDPSAPHLASSRLDILARITDAQPDISVLGTRLLHPGLPPHPLRDRSPWQGVRAVAPGHAATLQQGKTFKTRAWWTPPEPVRSLEEAASELAAALHLSVTERINALCSFEERESHHYGGSIGRPRLNSPLLSDQFLRCRFHNIFPCESRSRR